MSENIWDTKLDGRETMSVLSFREPGPLEGCPGTDAYFNAVMGSLRREAISRQGYFAEPKAKATRVKVFVIRANSDCLSSQHCGKCGRLMANEPCKASKNAPAVFCLDCFASAKPDDIAHHERQWGNLEDARISLGERRNAPMNSTMATCPVCSKEFTPQKTWGKYCSRKCGDVARMRAYRERKKPKDTPPAQS